MQKSETSTDVIEVTSSTDVTEDLMERQRQEFRLQNPWKKFDLALPMPEMSPWEKEEKGRHGDHSGLLVTNLAPGVLRDPLAKNRNNEECNIATYWVCFSSLHTCSFPHTYTYITFMYIHTCKFTYTKHDHVLQLERKLQEKTIVLFIG